MIFFFFFRHRVVATSSVNYEPLEQGRAGTFDSKKPVLAGLLALHSVWGPAQKTLCLQSVGEDTYVWHHVSRESWPRRLLCFIRPRVSEGPILGGRNKLLGPKFLNRASERDSRLATEMRCDMATATTIDDLIYSESLQDATKFAY